MAKVSVCIPSLSERSKLLKEMIDSLQKQTFNDADVIVCMDITPVGKAKSEVVKRALKTKCEYICMLDDDDVIEPDYLQEVVSRLDRGDIDWCFTWGRLFGDKKREGYIHGEIQTIKELEKWNGHPAWISAKREVFEKIKFDESLDYGEDWDLWKKILNKKLKGGVIEKELYLKRWHKNSLTGMRADY